MTRHMTRRECGKGSGFSWTSTFKDDDASVLYLLFRRDHSNKLHSRILTFRASEPRSLIAERLNRARHQLREKVDEIDLAALLSEDQAA